MKVFNLSQKDLELSFVTDAPVAFANSLRRSIMTLVPTLAVENVEIFENSSALYDEIIAHRLGLLPLTTDLKAYKLPSEFPDDGVERAETYVTITLEAQGPGIVYASEIKSKDPKVKCAFDKIPVVKLLKNQSIKLEAKALLGQGIEHAKWASGAAYYQESSKDVDTKKLHDQKSKEVEGNEALVFTVESWGQLEPKEVVQEAVNQLDKQLDELAQVVKTL